MSLLLLSCGKSDLRGRSTTSADGKTYLVVVEAPGCAGLYVDGKPWPHALGARGLVPAGRRQISCADGGNHITFEVRRGQTFRFDYWGP